MAARSLLSLTMRRVLALTACVLVATVATAWLPVATRAIAPALVALVAGLLLWSGADTTRIGAERRLAEAEAKLADVAKAGSQLRHDLRGILSPALLTADRLSNSQDPATRKAAEAMISTVERAEIRLRAPP